MHDDSRPSDSPDSPGDASPPGDPRWDALARSLSGDPTGAEASRDGLPAGANALLRVVDRVANAATDAGAAAPVDVEAALASVRARIAADAAVAEAMRAEAVSADSVVHDPSRVSRPVLTLSRGTGAPGAAGAPASTPRQAGRALSLRRAGGLAAAAALVLALGVGTWRAGPDTDRAAGAEQVYTTRVGVRDSVLLTDGSRVILAPGSRLTVLAQFAIERTVVLEGAAFFEVRHDEAHPFTVRSRDAEIRDVGTAFSVNTDVTGSVVVAVTEGVVAVRRMASASAAPVELRAGDRGVLPAAGVGGTAAPTDEMLVHRGAVTPASVAWTRGELTYRDTPLGEVQADLRRWYGIELRTADSVVAGRTLTASLRTDSLAQALQIITFALGAEMTRQGDTVTLRAGVPGARP